MALRSHYLFESTFTLAGREGAHEKGGVESEVGRFRRRHLRAVPRIETLCELNAGLRAACERDLGRRISARPETVGEALARERHCCAPCLPAEPFPSAEDSLVRASTRRASSPCVTTATRCRSDSPADGRVRASVGAREIRVLHDGSEVARHERLCGRLGVSAKFDHYLELLRRNPTALAGSLWSSPAFVDT
ncbi:MAG: hypothetical protein LC790_03065 [Actinobacteria bacterium]|nr:hypothetical protein [Actinomycetota bacterium]